MLEIVKAGDFAGGVASQRQCQIVGMDAGTVIANPDQADTALFHFNRNPGGTGVQAVSGVPGPPRRDVQRPRRQRSLSQLR